MINFISANKADKMQKTSVALKNNYLTYKKLMVELQITLLTFLK
jgi:hypothetical protein